MYKVIQWATGTVGQSAIKAIIGRDDTELVGCYVTNPDKVGRDAGEIAGEAAIGVRATNDKQAILSIQADCVIYVPIMHDIDEICALLESGKNVVTGCPYNSFLRVRIASVSTPPVQSAGPACLAVASPPGI